MDVTIDLAKAIRVINKKHGARTHNPGSYDARFWRRAHHGAAAGSRRPGAKVDYEKLD